MSFDNTGERLEYVRHGAKWDQIQQNLSTIKGLMKLQGQWGGIHAVYNIYSATRLCEFRQFAEDTKITVLWQNLFQPNYLDPFLLGTQVAKLATEEIHKFYSLGIATDVERVFFDQALEKYGQAQDNPAMQTKFQKHIHDNETVYHPDKAGEFARLWPELI
jgi:hypothetical protein